MTETHPWCRRVLAPIPRAAVSAAVAADHPSWELIEAEMVKLGSLAHTRVALDAVAEHCLLLLESCTKDMRVLAQLLRCLQHPAQAAKLATALRVLDCWLEAFWSQAFPVGAGPKVRLLLLITRRFETALGRASTPDADDALQSLPALFAQVAGRCQAYAPDSAQLLMTLSEEARRALETQISPRSAAGRSRESEPQPALPAGEPLAEGKPVTGSTPVVRGGTAGVAASEDISAERAWRQRQLKMADLLVEAQPALPIGYQLRRHAIWSAITATPLATPERRTSLAAMPADLVQDYRAALGRPDMALWMQIERSLVLAPYWFEGHRFSAQIAGILGYQAVAGAIAAELTALLARLPDLRDLAFSNGTPFLDQECLAWLQPPPDLRDGGDEQIAALLASCCQTRGVVAALQALDEHLLQQQEPRARFYSQLAGADLLASAGMHALAAQHYQHLWQETQRLGLSQWEPGLVSRLAHHVTIRSS